MEKAESGERKTTQMKPEVCGHAVATCHTGLCLLLYDFLWSCFCAVASGHAKAATQNKPAKKRFIWSDQLHAQFVAALFDHGLKTASPRLLLDLMPTPGELTTEHVKSHLQKYRLHRDKSREDFLHRFAQQLDQGFEKDDSTVQRVCCEDAGSSCRNLPLVHSIAPMKIPQLVCASESDCVDQHRNVLQQHLALISEGIAMQTSFQQQLAQLVNCQLSSHQSLQDHSNLLTSSGSSGSSSSSGGVSSVHHNPPASPTPSDGSSTQPVSSRCCSSNSTTSSTAAAAAAAAAEGTFALTAAAAATADVKPTANERCYDNGNANGQCYGTGVTGPSLSRLQEHRPREVQYEPGAYILINNTSSSSNGSSAVSASFGVVPLTGTAASHAVRSNSSTASQHARISSSSNDGIAIDDRSSDRMQCDSGHHSTDRSGVNSSSNSSNSNSKGATTLAPASAGNSALHAHSGATDRLHAQMCAQMDLHRQMRLAQQDQAQPFISSNTATSVSSNTDTLSATTALHSQQQQQQQQQQSVQPRVAVHTGYSGKHSGSGKQHQHQQQQQQQQQQSNYIVAPVSTDSINSEQLVLSPTAAAAAAAASSANTATTAWMQQSQLAHELTASSMNNHYNHFGGYGAATVGGADDVDMDDFSWLANPHELQQLDSMHDGDTQHDDIALTGVQQQQQQQQQLQYSHSTTAAAAAATFDHDDLTIDDDNTAVLFEFLTSP
eukprot:5324-Heterococcus_DN1.PRE.2